MLAALRMEEAEQEAASCHNICLVRVLTVNSSDLQRVISIANLREHMQVWSTRLANLLILQPAGVGVTVPFACRFLPLVISCMPDSAKLLFLVADAASFLAPFFAFLTGRVS